MSSDIGTRGVPRHRPLYGGRSPFTGTRGDHDLSSHQPRSEGRRLAGGRSRGLGLPAGPLLLQAGYCRPYLLADANLGEWGHPRIDAVVLVSTVTPARYRPGAVLLPVAEGTRPPRGVAAVGVDGRRRP